jgi:hypothetical protein
VLDPLPLDGSGPGGDPPSGNDPHRGQIALLPEVGSHDSHVEIPALHSAQPPLEDADCRVDGNRLMGIGGRAGPERSGVDPVLPEERADPGPVPLRQPLGVSAQDLVDRIFIPAGTSRGAILDPASRARQETETEDRETQATQADRWCVSST